MSFVQVFQEMKRIYGICPCCGDPFRLSDTTPFTKAAPPTTPFDELDDARASVAAGIERFEASEEKIRERSRTEGRRTADRQLAKVLPFFTSRKVELRDVKVLFHPVDYVAFCGMSRGQCLSVDFVDRPPESRAREALQKSIGEAIRHARIEWQIYRISVDGMVTASGGGKRRKS